MIVGTAGHVDHGKTSLIRALTGRDTDRLPEERRRGISIELGYAFLPLPGDRTLAFVDVPGHERFVHTMLAGATGMDAAMLVVAADDGVMPQTEEHLDILRLLGVARGLVVVTKVDAVDDARRREARDSIAAWLAGSAEAGWPVMEASTVTGEGVDACRAALAALAGALDRRPDTGAFRLAIDRVFTLGGVGTIVTGTVHAGAVREGDDVRLTGSGRLARVRSIHAQDRRAPVALPGERCALNLAGIGRDEIGRGEWVQGPTLDNDATRFDALLRLSPREARALTSSSVVHLHHGARDALARVGILDAPSAAPGAEVLATFTLDGPIPASRGDRFVIRDASSSRTVGGGRVLDIDPPARHKRAPARLAVLRALAHGPDEVALAARLESGPWPVARWRGAWNLEPAQAQALRLAAHARLAGDNLFAAARWAAQEAALVAALRATHEREPEMPGLEQDRLRRMAAPATPKDAYLACVEGLLAAGTVARRGAFLALPGHRAELAREERERWERVKPLLMEAPYCPPRVRDLAKASGQPEGEVRALLRKVSRVGEVVLVAHDHFFLAEAVADLADHASTVAREQEGVARAAPFRDRIGGGRKVAIQILEFFDRVGYTRRIRDDHVVRRDNPWR